VRVAVTGASMRPFIRSGDVVELSAADGALPRPGAVVLVEAAGGRLLLHRVTASARPGVRTRGDANREGEGPFPPERVVARVTGVVDGGRVRPLDRGLYGALARTWAASGAGHVVLRLGGAAARAGRRLLRPGGARGDRGPLR